MKRVSISLFFEKKRVPSDNGYVGVLGSDFEKSSRKSSMSDFGQHVFTIAPMMVVQDSKRSYLLT